MKNIAAFPWEDKGNDSICAMQVFALVKAWGFVLMLQQRTFAEYEITSVKGFANWFADHGMNEVSREWRHP